MSGYDTVVRAASNLAAARVREAEAFLRFRNSSAKTDGAARAMAIIETGSEVDRREADYQVALALLRAKEKEKPCP
jgi:multidrug efflux pump subunit AcrA (membrane-fusion protein)